MISTKDLQIGYSSSILEVEDLSLEAGKTYVLLGSNGSGKSTFLKTISAQIKPIKGACFIDEHSIGELSMSDLPKTVSFVSSKLDETDYLTTQDYIALGRSPYTNNFGRINAQDQAKIDLAIEKLEIQHLRNRFINELSDGEKQLVAIAKSIAQETKVILLDEPTAFLDYKNKLLIMKQLISIAKEYRKCIVMSSHDLDVSINSNCRFLLVDQLSSKIIQLPATTSKEKLISLAY